MDDTRGPDRDTDRPRAFAALELLACAAAAFILTAIGYGIAKILARIFL